MGNAHRLGAERAVADYVSAVLLKTKTIPASLASAFKESGVDGASVSDLRRLVKVGSAAAIEAAVFAIVEGCVRSCTESPLLACLAIALAPHALAPLCQGVDAAARTYLCPHRRRGLRP